MRRPVAVLALFTFMVMITPASALTKAKTRDVQEKLTLLGYEPGPIDGRYGPKSESAVRLFQVDAEIKVDGKVGPQTLGALEDKVAGKTPAAPPRLLDAQYNQLDIYDDILSDRLAAGNTAIPSRYGNFTIAKAAPGSFEVAFNGQVFATSPKGAGLPRISHTYHVPGEDVVLLTSRSANRDCPVTSVVLVVRANGLAMPPSEVGNCEAAVNARVQDRQVVFSFPPKNVESWRMVESWVYENGKIEPR